MDLTASARCSFSSAQIKVLIPTKILNKVRCKSAVLAAWARCNNTEFRSLPLHHQAYSYLLPRPAPGALHCHGSLIYTRKIEARLKTRHAWTQSNHNSSPWGTATSANNNVVANFCYPGMLSERVELAWADCIPKARNLVGKDKAGTSDPVTTSTPHSGKCERRC